MSEDRDKVIKAPLDNQQPRGALAAPIEGFFKYHWEPCGEKVQCLTCKGPMEHGRRPLQGVMAGMVRCLKCGRQMGFSSYFIRSAFPVEPLPDGARLFYDKEPPSGDEGGNDP